MFGVGEAVLTHAICVGDRGRCWSLPLLLIILFFDTGSSHSTRVAASEPQESSCLGAQCWGYRFLPLTRLYECSGDLTWVLTLVQKAFYPLSHVPSLYFLNIQESSKSNVVAHFYNLSTRLQRQEDQEFRDTPAPVDTKPMWGKSGYHETLSQKLKRERLNKYNTTEFQWYGNKAWKQINTRLWPGRTQTVNRNVFKKWELTGRQRCCF